MLIHLGESRSIFCKDIIAILELSNEELRASLPEAEARDPKMKSCIITEQERIYTQFTPLTLTKRAENLLLAYE